MGPHNAPPSRHIQSTDVNALVVFAMSAVTKTGTTPPLTLGSSAAWLSHAANHHGRSLLVNGHIDGPHAR